MPLQQNLPNSLASNDSCDQPEHFKHDKQELIPTTRITALIKFFAAQGHPLQSLLAETNIALLDLSRAKIFVSIKQFEQLLANAYRIASDHSFAAQLGEQSFVNNGNLLTSRVMHSETVEEALMLLINYQSLLNDILTLRLEPADKGLYLKIESNESLGSALPFFVEHTFSTVYALGKFSLGQPALSIRHDFSYSRPENADYFARYFSSDLHFDQPSNQAYIPAQLLRQKLIFSDKNLAARKDKQCQEKIREINNQHGVLHKVRHLFKRHPLNTLSHERLAELLHLSPRTLRRQLSAQGCSYSQLLEEERKKIAATEIAAQAITLDQLAHKLGYRDQSSFSRAFKRWYGVPPKHYQPNSNDKKEPYFRFS